VAHDDSQHLEALLTKLTKKQEVVLRYLQDYVACHQCSPLIREIQAGCQIASYKSAVDRLNALEHKGFIKRLPNKHRGIYLKRRLHDPQPSAVSDVIDAPAQQPVASSEPA